MLQAPSLSLSSSYICIFTYIHENRLHILINIYAKMICIWLVFNRVLTGLLSVFRDGHFRYFLNFFNNKKYLFAFFINLITISAPVLFKKPTPSQINFIKNVKYHFSLLKMFKNTKSVQLCTVKLFYIRDVLGVLCVAGNPDV